MAAHVPVDECDDISAVTDGLNQLVLQRCYRQWWHAGMRHGGHCFNINDIACRVLIDSRRRLRFDRRSAASDSGHHPQQTTSIPSTGACEQTGVSPAIELVVKQYFGFGEGQNRIVDLRATSTDSQCSNATLEISYSLLSDIVGFINRVLVFAPPN